MPKIPTYLSSLDYRSARGDVEGAGASGRMLAQFGTAIGEFGGQIARQVDLAEQARKAQAEAERANGTSQAMTALRQTIDEFEQDSDPNTLMDRWVERADSIGQEIFGAIRNPQARAQVEADYQALAKVHRTLIQSDSVRRLAAQGRRDLDSNLTLYAAAAAAARHPVEHDDAVDLAMREIQGKADAGFITGEDAARIEQSFYGDIAERQARLAIAADPQSALASLEGDEDFAALAPDRHARLVTEADRAVQAQTVRRQTEAAALRRETLVRLPKYLDGLRDGDAPDDERFSRESLIATLGEEDGAARWAEIESAQAFGEQMAMIRWATPGEIAERVSAHETATEQSETAGLLALAAARREEQLLSKPADYVLKNPRVAKLHTVLMQVTAQPKLPPALSTALRAGGNPLPAVPPSDAERRGAIAAYANATLAEQARLGVPDARRQVLPEAMAQELAAGILGSDPAQADQTLRDLAADWGEDWPRVLDDLRRNGLPPAYADLAAAETPVARQIFADVLATQTSEPGTLRAKVGDDADSIDDLVHRYRDDGLLSNDRVRLVKLVAYHHATLSEPEEAVRRAISDFTGDIILTAGSEGASESDDIADAWRDKGERMRRRHWQEFGKGVSGSLERLAHRPDAQPAEDDYGNPIMAPVIPTKSEKAEWDLLALEERERLPKESQAKIPRGWTLNHFAMLGEALRARDPFGRSLNIPSATALAALANFRQGGPWDLQRPGLQKDSSGRYINYPEFVDISTMAIGVFAAAAGIDLDFILFTSNKYARERSNFTDAEMSEEYPYLPKRNVENTRRGYELYLSGRIKAKSRFAR